MTKNIRNAASDLASDLIWGTTEIGEYIGRPERAVFYMLNQGLLPGKKLGGRWVASKAKLRAYLTELLEVA
jgi:hypothetical protein